VTHVVSQSDVIKLLWNNRAVFGPVLSSTVESLEMDDGAALTVPATLPALEAFGFMARDHKSSLGLTDGGKLVANLSVSDIR
jgi:CBS domain-containing protein